MNERIISVHFFHMHHFICMHVLFHNTCICTKFILVAVPGCKESKHQVQVILQLPVCLLCDFSVYDSYFFSLAICQPQVSDPGVWIPDSLKIPASHLKLASYSIGQGKLVKGL